MLPAGNHQQVPFAYKMYIRDNDEGREQSTKFKKAFSIDVEIEFLGVWYTPFFPPAICLFPSNSRCRETVFSVGVIPHHLPFTRSNTSIRHFRHAISLDEHRAKFQPNYFHRLTDSDHEGTKPGDMPRSNQHRPFYYSGHHYKAHTEEEKDVTRPDVREVWFAGCHCGMCNPVEPAFPI